MSETVINSYLQCDYEKSTHRILSTLNTVEQNVDSIYQQHCLGLSYILDTANTSHFGCDIKQGQHDADWNYSDNKEFKWNILPKG